MASQQQHSMAEKFRVIQDELLFTLASRANGYTDLDELAQDFATDTGLNPERIANEFGFSSFRQMVTSKEMKGSTVLMMVELVNGQHVPTYLAAPSQCTMFGHIRNEQFTWELTNRRNILAEQQRVLLLQNRRQRQSATQKRNNKGGDGSGHNPSSSSYKKSIHTPKRKLTLEERFPPVFPSKNIYMEQGTSQNTAQLAQPSLPRVANNNNNNNNTNVNGMVVETDEDDWEIGLEEEKELMNPNDYEDGEDGDDETGLENMMMTSTTITPKNGFFSGTVQQHMPHRLVEPKPPRFPLKSREQHQTRPPLPNRMMEEDRPHDFGGSISNDAQPASSRHYNQQHAARLANITNRRPQQQQQWPPQPVPHWTLEEIMGWLRKQRAKPTQFINCNLLYSIKLAPLDYNAHFKTPEWWREWLTHILSTKTEEAAWLVSQVSYIRTNSSNNRKITNIDQFSYSLFIGANQIEVIAKIYKCLWESRGQIVFNNKVLTVCTCDKPTADLW